MYEFDYSKFTDEELEKGIEEDAARFAALTREEYLTTPNSHWCKWPMASAHLVGRRISRSIQDAFLKKLEESLTH